MTKSITNASSGPNIGSSKKIVIVGAGLVGSLWAVLLQKRGYQVTVLEKRPDMRKTLLDGGRSINLVITARGLYGLERAGLLSEALALSVPVYGRMIHSKTGETLYQPYGVDEECNHSISRAELNKFLMSAAERTGAKIYFEHTVESIDFKNRTIHCSPTTLSYDLLFGADGAGSQVRKTLVKNFPDEFRDSIEWLDADYKEMVIPAGPKSSHRLEKSALHIWPRGSHMMMALANLDGSFTVTVYLPKQGDINSFASLKTRADVDKLFNREFSDALPLMPYYLEEFENNPQGALGTVRCSKWVYGDSVALLGDAAHAILPFFGQGMNCGFEDCTTLLDIMIKNEESQKSNWHEILATYDQTQRPNANAIADMAIENWTEMRDRVSDPKFQLRKKLETLIERQFPDIFKSRYGMITYTRIPYAKAQAAGRLQDIIFGKLCEGLQTPEQVSLSKAEDLLRKDFVPFLQKQGIEF